MVVLTVALIVWVVLFSAPAPAPLVAVAERAPWAVALAVDPSALIAAVTRSTPLVAALRLIEGAVIVEDAAVAEAVERVLEARAALVLALRSLMATEAPKVSALLVRGGVGASAASCRGLKARPKVPA